MSEPGLISRAQAGDLLGGVKLATCSYYEYRRGTGTATRITRGAPRGVSLPNPRWTGLTRWPSAPVLAPGRDYFGQGLPPEEFADRYVADLDRAGVDLIAAALRQVPVEDGRLVLLCFEKTAAVEANPLVCHRRIFAQWWAGKTGQDVPELNC